MKKGFLLLTMLLSTTFAQAETMSCIIGVYKPSNLSERGEEKARSIVDVPLVDGHGETTVKINGEEVEVFLTKKQYADVYTLFVTLTTPHGDRYPGSGFVAAIQENLVNDGPAESAWNIKPGPGAINYEYLNYDSGTLTLTGKAVKALQAEGLWGKFPFTSQTTSVSSAGNILPTLAKLAKKGKLGKNDVIALATIFSCTKNN